LKTYPLKIKCFLKCVGENTGIVTKFVSNLRRNKSKSQ